MSVDKVQAECWEAVKRRILDDMVNRLLIQDRHRLDLMKPVIDETLEFGTVYIASDMRICFSTATLRAWANGAHRPGR